MNFDDPADEGLLKALKSRWLPKDGLAVELGAGTARNLRAMAKCWPNALGYELDAYWLQKANEAIEEEGLLAKVQFGNVLELAFEPNSLAAAVVAITVYLPKSCVYELLQKVWAGLKRYGVLHVEFATPNDHVSESDFFLYTCLPYPEDSYANSYGHYCGSYTCQLEHPGVFGASLWTPDEAKNALKGLGKGKIVHTELREWHQEFLNEDGDTEFVTRSFYLVTMQKR